VPTPADDLPTLNGRETKISTCPNGAFAYPRRGQVSLTDLTRIKAAPPARVHDRHSGSVWSSLGLASSARWAWGLTGIVPLATGLTGNCPAYTLIGANTCRR